MTNKLMLTLVAGTLSAICDALTAEQRQTVAERLKGLAVLQNDSAKSEEDHEAAVMLSTFAEIARGDLQSGIDGLNAMDKIK